MSNGDHGFVNTETTKPTEGWIRLAPSASHQP
jgi:hypothetical protein